MPNPTEISEIYCSKCGKVVMRVLTTERTFISISYENARCSPEGHFLANLSEAPGTSSVLVIR